jgi:hypothetical protein
MLQIRHRSTADNQQGHQRCRYTQPDQAQMGSDLTRYPQPWPSAIGDHRGALAATAACSSALDGRSGRRRCETMPAIEEIRRRHHAKRALPGGASGSGGGRG